MLWIQQEPDNELKNTGKQRKEEVLTYCSSVCAWYGCILIFFKKDPGSCDFGTTVLVHVFNFLVWFLMQFSSFSLLNNVPSTTIQREQSITKAHAAANTSLFVEFAYRAASKCSELVSTKCLRTTFTTRYLEGPSLLCLFWFPCLLLFITYISCELTSICIYF